MRALLRLPIWCVAVVLSACIDDAPPYADAPCPCAAPFVCCESSGRCVSESRDCPEQMHPMPDAAVADAAPVNELHITPTQGPSTGGTRVRLEASPLPEAPSVFIADQPCRDLMYDGAAITCITPPSAIPWATVRVEGSDGTLTRPEAFHYLQPLLTDASAAAGLDVFTDGVTVSVLDADADGRLDLLFAAGSRRRPLPEGQLYLADTEGGFADASDAEWLERIGWSYGLYPADFDNDGVPDLLAASTHGAVREGQPLARYLKGLPGGGFSAPLGVPYFADDEELRPVIVDLDADGFLDVFAAVRYAQTPARRLILLRNTNGALELEPDAGLVITSTALSSNLFETVTLTDMDADGLPDVILCGEQLRLLHNTGGSLVDVTEQVGLTPPSMPCHSATSVDLNNDGRLDIIWHTHSNVLFDTGDAQRSGTTVLENTPDGFRSVPYLGADAVGDHCLSPRVPGRTLDAGSNGAVVNDFDLDGDWDIFLPSPFGLCASAPLIYENQTDSGHFGFTPIQLTADWWLGRSTGAVSADLDGDGDVEVAVQTWGYNAKPRLFEGRAMDNGTGHFLRISPRRSGRAAWGARVDMDLDGPSDSPDFAQGGGRLLTAQLTGSASMGMGDPALTLGLGDRPPPYHVRVTFSDATQCVVRIETPDSKHIVEYASCARVSP